MATVAIVKVIADISTFLAIDSFHQKEEVLNMSYNVLCQSGLAVVNVLIFDHLSVTHFKDIIISSS